MLQQPHPCRSGPPVLFNSAPFLFVFLPIALAVYLTLRNRHPQLANGWLLVASLFFYGWWEVRFLPVLLSSIVANFLLGRAISRRPEAGHALLAAGVALNLTALGCFKYANFLIANVAGLVGANWPGIDIPLPIGISFFTFTQIAYLVDACQRKAEEPDPIRYGLFVTYFPHLIAGPILHHGEMMPQFADRRSRDRLRDIAVGLVLLSAGLFKKVVIADSIAQYSTPVFATFDAGGRLSVVEAWVGALAYAFQIYFDFSAYCDMALGISRMFGILLPINFLSPYQATSIIDFWRRWHITLSRFLRDYLYIPLGGNRRGPLRRQANLALTMVLGGLWHGASWNFVIWGALHGTYLVINHAWRRLTREASGPGQRYAEWTLTFLAVVTAWVFFRATTTRGAWAMIETMYGLRGPVRPDAMPVRPLLWLSVLLLFCALAPNLYVVLRRFEPGLYPHWFAGSHAARRPVVRELSFAGGLCCGVLFMVALVVMLQLSRQSEFLYFQF
ncbi:MAG: MBOAT family protein [Microvirga sp.]